MLYTRASNPTSATGGDLRLIPNIARSVWTRQAEVGVEGSPQVARQVKRVRGSYHALISMQTGRAGSSQNVDSTASRPAVGRLEEQGCRYTT